ncbi:hypothetical protein HYW21_02815 [Candidatus Woesearchaeota archaeon]|nr:hypothetical protein [Candidatus Woesearchaeota archaeon]
MKPMINQQDFQKLKKAIASYDAKREELIKKSRDIVVLSKQIIYAIHRGDMKRALELVPHITELITDLKTGGHAHSGLTSEGFYRMAMQEYVEALCYYEFMVKQSVPNAQSLGVEPEEYLLGICDLYGELVRKAINASIEGNDELPVIIRSFLLELYGQLLLFDFRNTDLRKKFDGLKYSLTKMDELVLSIKNKQH